VAQGVVVVVVAVLGVQHHVTMLQKPPQMH
jgi:hypothetical protein